MKLRNLTIAAVLAVCALDMMSDCCSYGSLALSNMLALPLVLLVLDQISSVSQWKWYVLAATLTSSALLSFCPQTVKLSLRPALFMSIACLDAIFTLKRHLSKPRSLFKNSSIWNTIEELSRMFLLQLYIVALALSLMPWVTARICSALLAAVVVFYEFRKQQTGHCCLVSGDKEKLIKDIAKGDLRGPQIYEDSAGNRKMNALYERAVEYMEKNSPYLDEFFNLDDFSRKLYTNKVYLSRTINVYSGRNFRQFVNYYRVKYSIELMRRDTRLKVDELATMSGFHSNVSYNMAFRLFMNETPKEWMNSHRSELSEGVKALPADRERSSDVNL